MSKPVKFKHLSIGAVFSTVPEHGGGIAYIEWCKTSDSTEEMNCERVSDPSQKRCAKPFTNTYEVNKP